MTSPAAIEAALARGEPVQQIVVPEGACADLQDLLARADASGVPVVRVSARQFRRLRPANSESGALASVGASVDAGFEEVLAGDGAAWLLLGTAYPGNAGFAIRTAEVSGADGIFIDADFDHAGRREALRVAMRADRFMPVFWESASRVLDTAARCGRECIAIEDVGTRHPWDVDLTGPTLFVVGSEAAGVPDAVLRRCDRVIRLPMAGFLRAYNVHASVASVASERLRQLEERGA